jgi:hypothetical protein
MTSNLKKKLYETRMTNNMARREYLVTTIEAYEQYHMQGSK